MATTKDNESLDQKKAVKAALDESLSLKELLAINEDQRTDAQKREIRRLKQDKKVADTAEKKAQALHDLVKDQKEAVEKLNDTTQTSFKEMGVDGRTGVGKQLEAIAQQNNWSKARLDVAKENAREGIDIANQIKAREEFLQTTTSGVMDASQDAELNEMKRHQTRLKSQQRILQDNRKGVIEGIRNFKINFAGMKDSFNSFVDTQKESISKGELSAKGLAGSFKDDFTRLAGPLGGILSQIPFLGTIAKLGKSILMRIVIRARDAWVRWRSDKATTKLQMSLQKKKEISEKRAQRRMVKAAKQGAPTPAAAGGGDKKGGGMMLGMKIRAVGTALATVLPLLGPALLAFGGSFAALAPLAGPMVVGAGGLALAIAALGVGVGVTLAAMALGVLAMGKALPVLSKGFESFSDLPADDIRYNISEIGKSMGWLLGLSLIAPLASLAGAVSGGIPKLATSFKAFSTENIDGADIGQNITNLGAGMEALGAISTGSLGAAFKGMIGDFFSGDGPGPLEKMANDLKHFENLDGDKLISIGPGITAVAEGIAAMNAGEGGAMDKIGSGLKSFLGGGTVDSLKAVAELPDTLATKANAIKAVADSFSILGTSLKGISSDNLEMLEDTMDALSSRRGDLLITPSVQIASVEGMAMPVSMISGAALAAGTIGSTTGTVIVNNVSAPTTQNNINNTQNVRATGTARSEQLVQQTH